jgi:HAD superfamily hydrolase (TIGR01509 family)
LGDVFVTLQIMIDVILFDLWETLATKRQRIFNTLQQRYKLPDDAFPLFKAQLLGLEISKITEEEFWQNLGRAYKTINSTAALSLIDIYREITIINEPLVDFAMNYKRHGGKIAIFSNTDPAAKDYLKEIGLLEKFDNAFFSFDAQMLKPDEQFITYALTKFNAKASHVAYFDDNSTCIKVAANLGVTGFVYTGMEAMKSQLRQTGLDGYIA